MGSVRSFSSFDAICYPQLISAVGVAFWWQNPDFEMSGICSKWWKGSVDSLLWEEENYLMFLYHKAGSPTIVVL